MSVNIILHDTLRNDSKLGLQSSLTLKLFDAFMAWKSASTQTHKTTNAGGAVTCDSLHHLHLINVTLGLEKSITCDSSPTSIQTRKGVG